jgi:endonuclease YncB( thermonuclease family)
MSRRASVLWIVLFVALALAGGTRLFDGDGQTQRQASIAPGSIGRVVRVVDGDTVRVRVGDRTTTVRYIGVDAPESVKPGEPVQCFAKRASEFNRRLVNGERVRLRFGPERFDRYGRLLAYVGLVDRNSRSVNALLIARGYARVLTIPPNTQHEQAYSRLEQRARERGLGLWSSCPRSAE